MVSIPPELKIQIKAALSEWVRTLPVADRRKSAINVSGRNFTAEQVLSEVEEETGLGKMFLTGVYSLYEMNRSEDPSATVMDLIHETTGVGRHSRLVNSQWLGQYKRLGNRDTTVILVGCVSSNKRFSTNDVLMDVGEIEEIKHLIEERAHELFVARGGKHGDDRQDWFQAQSEIFRATAVEVTETTTELVLSARLPDFRARESEVNRLSNNFVLIKVTGHSAFGNQSGGTLVLSEHPGMPVARLVSVPSVADLQRPKVSSDDEVLRVSLHKTAQAAFTATNGPATKSER